MRTYTLEQEQFIPAPAQEVWDFISSPANLSKITPDYMGFEITSVNLPDTIQPGLEISYWVSPLFGIKLKWVSAITIVESPDFFIDEQRKGPYRYWRHEHRLTSVNQGVLMHDIVKYTPPFGWIGDLANFLIIRRKLNEIFAYRRNALIRIFGEADSTLNA